MIITIEKIDFFKKWVVKVNGTIISKHYLLLSAKRIKTLLEMFNTLNKDTENLPKEDSPCYNPLLHGAFDISSGFTDTITEFVQVEKVKIDVDLTITGYQQVYYTCKNDFKNIWYMAPSNILSIDELNCINIHGGYNEHKKLICAIANKIINDGGFYSKQVTPKIIEINTTDENKNI